MSQEPRELTPVLLPLLGREWRLEDVQIARINLATEMQVRYALHGDVIREYQEQRENGAQFPPVELVYDGSVYHIADGWHRLWAARGLNAEYIRAFVCDGTARDALRLALRANSTHGIRRSRADIQRALRIALMDDEWSKLSNREIAELCQVHPRTVEKFRIEFQNVLRVLSGPKSRVEETAEPGDTVDLSVTPAAIPNRLVKTISESPPVVAPPDIASRVQGALATGDTFTTLIKSLEYVEANVMKLAETEGGFYLSQHVDVIRSHLDATRKLLAASKPVGICRVCMGVASACAACQNLGWLPAARHAVLAAAQARARRVRKKPESGNTPVAEQPADNQEAPE